MQASLEKPTWGIYVGNSWGAPYKETRIERRSLRVKNWTFGRKKERHINSRHVKYTTNWQWGDLKGLIKCGYLKGETWRKSMHVHIEHANHKG